ncbi:hypothetical protein Z043_116429, partial [Scleropages formosus]
MTAPAPPSLPLKDVTWMPTMCQDRRAELLLVVGLRPRERASERCYRIRSFRLCSWVTRTCSTINMTAWSNNLPQLR